MSAVEGGEAEVEQLPHHPVTPCSTMTGDGEGTSSLIPPPRPGWKGTKSVQPNMVNKQAGGHLRMAWPHAG